MATTLATSLPLLREHLHKNITQMWVEYDKQLSPTLAGMESRGLDDGGGRGYVVPIETTMGSAVGPTFGTAQALAQGTASGSTPGRDRWVCQHTEVHAMAYWSRAAMLAAESKGAGEVFDLLEREIGAATGRLKKRMAHAAVEQGYGRIGTISAVTSTTVTIGASTINRVSVGDELVAAAAHTTGALRSATMLRVDGWDPDTGIMTMSADPTALGWAANDTVFFDGYRNTTTPLMPFGLGAWVPGAAPTSTTFCGINRLGNPDLGGHRVSATGLDHASAFIRAANRAFKYGTKMDAIYCSPEDYEILSADKDATKTIQIGVGKYEIAFDGVTVNTHAGACPVIPDVMYEQGTAWGGPWKSERFAPFIAHNDDLVNIDDIDGLQFTRAATSTNFEMRLYFRGQIIVPAPGKFTCITSLPSA